MWFKAAIFVATLIALSGVADALIKALDLSGPQTTSIWQCVQNQGFVKGIPRMYQEACVNPGGQIDPTFLTSYNQIRDSGIKNIDAYFFPCTGSTHNCKSPKTQVQEIVNFLSSNKLNITRLWLDLEPDTTICHAWDYGHAGNAALARQFAAEMRATKLKWGVYANRNQWVDLFGSLDVDIASDLPLWAVQWDGVSTLSSVTQFMGGWKSAFAKQYGESTGACAAKGAFDLNVFTE